MKSMRIVVIVGLAAMLMLGLPVESEADKPAWPTEGTPVFVAPGNDTDPLIIHDGSGGAIVAWRSSDSPHTLVQRLNDQGIPQWSQTGIGVVGGQAPPAYCNRMITDGSGGAILVGTSTGDYVTSLFAQRISPSGSRAWGNNGVQISTGNQFGEQQLCSDGSGGAVIIYKDYIAGMVAQKINASGEKQWGENGIIVNAATNLGSFAITHDGTGGVLLAWVDNQESLNSNIYAQRIDGEGNLLWTAGGVAVCTAPGDQNGCRIANRNGGAIITWVDNRNPDDCDIYAQYVDGAGVARWSSNGVPVCSARGSQTNPAVVPDNQNGALIAWVDNRKMIPDGQDIFAQRLNASGSRLWGDSGLPICTSTPRQKAPFIVSDNNGGAFIVWQDMISSYSGDFYFQHVDASGNTHMVSDGANVYIAEGGQSNASVYSDGQGGFLMAWEDSRHEAPSVDIYAQKISPGEPYATWYLAEGCTKGGFETWVLVQNPGDNPVQIDMAFQTDNGRVQGPQDTVPANSRRTYNVSEYVQSYNVSTKVTASGNIVCERAMYGNNRAWGHDSIGVISPSKTWYLAEGCTKGGFETWVLVQNPGDNPVQIDMAFQTDNGRVQGPQETVPANSRRTYNVGEYVQSYNVSTTVNADNGYIICERAMYGNNRAWGHDSVGVTFPASTWSLAEGCTAGDFETWVLVQNPHDRSMEVEIYFLTDTEVVEGPREVIPANSRRTYNAGEYVQSYFVSTIVNVTTYYGSIICERAMYGGNRTWGHNSVGTPFASNAWLLAEGCTESDFETWVLVQNPSDQEIDIDMIFMTDSDMVQGPRDTLPAFSRKSYNVGDYVTSYNVSTLVTSGNGFFNCERSMYGNGRTWGHNSPGFLPVLGFSPTAQAAKTAALPLNFDRP